MKHTEWSDGRSPRVKPDAKQAKSQKQQRKEKKALSWEGPSSIARSTHITSVYTRCQPTW